MFGLVEQDYTLPKEVIEQMGIETFDYETFHYDTFEPESFSFDSFETDTFEPDTLDVTFVPQRSDWRFKGRICSVKRRVIERTIVIEKQ